VKITYFNKTEGEQQFRGDFILFYFILSKIDSKSLFFMDEGGAYKLGWCPKIERDRDV